MTNTFKRKNKYNARRTEYNGVTYDSKKEAEYALKLDILQQSAVHAINNGKKLDPEGQLIEIHRQYPMPITINGKKCFKYVCDFRLTFADGHVEYHDVKGYRDAVYRLKKKVIEAFYGITIVEI